MFRCERRASRSIRCGRGRKFGTPSLSEANTTSENTAQSEVAPSNAWSHGHGTPQRVAQSPASRAFQGPRITWPGPDRSNKVYDDALRDAFYQKTITTEHSIHYLPKTGPMVIPLSYLVILLQISCMMRAPHLVPVLCPQY